MINMEQLIKLQSEKAEIEESIISELYEKFLNKSKITTHSILNPDMKCTKLIYSQIHLDTGGIVGNEYSVCITFSNKTNSLVINKRKDNLDSGSIDDVTFYFNNKLLYKRCEVYGCCSIQHLITFWVKIFYPKSYKIYN